MNWQNPKELPNYLVAIDLQSLDFLPDNFWQAVEKGLPFRYHNTASARLVDSLYYSLAVSTGAELIDGLQSTDYNEPYYNQHKAVENGEYTKESYEVNRRANNSDGDDMPRDTISTAIPCAIDPAVIKVLKSPQYEGSLIATREFASRLKAIRRSCKPGLVEIYAKNIGKNLYELDSLAARSLETGPAKEEFSQFAAQRLTNVKQADVYAALLKGYYEKQLAEVRNELEAKKAEMVSMLKEANQAVEKIADEYRSLLWQREKYRMQAYGFTWSQTGWLNVDRGILPKMYDSQPFEVLVENGKEFDRVYTYIFYTSIKSLYRLNTNDNQLFFVGNQAEKRMLMPKQDTAVLVAVGYRGDSMALAKKEFLTGSKSSASLKLIAASTDGLQAMIAPYETFGKENQISEDLAYMAKFYQEQQRQKKLRKESEFISKLRQVALACCEDDVYVVVDEPAKPQGGYETFYNDLRKTTLTGCLFKKLRFNQ
jgi:hypothetical protein